MEVAWVRAKVAVKVAARMDAEDAKAVVNIHVRPCAVILVVEVVKTHARHPVAETVSVPVVERVGEAAAKCVQVLVWLHVMALVQI